MNAKNDNNTLEKFTVVSNAACALLGTLACTLTLVGCGDGHSGTDMTPDPAPATVPTPTAPTTQTSAMLQGRWSSSDPAYTAILVPSTACQQDLVNLLADELRAMGAQDVITTEHAYVTAHVPATPGLEGLPTLALNAHVDAESSVPGNGVKPQVVDYQGGKLVMGVVDGVEVYTDPSINPELNDMVGRQIICTDGRTLLAADDKAGVAEIMALAKRLLDDPSIPHPRLAISFVPDEELGHGAALLDLDEHGATWGYTLDGGPIGVMNYECFNAAEAKVRFAGFSVHPGTSKDRMVNAVEIACQYENLMPPQAKPQYTDGYDGFIHLHDLRGGVESAEAWYIIRDHDSGRLEAKKEVMRQAAADAVEEAILNAMLGADDLTGCGNTVLALKPERLLAALQQVGWRAP